MSTEGESFERDGYLVIQDVFDPASILQARTVVTSNFESIMNKISVDKLHFGIGVKHGFKEIVQRQPMRYEMTYNMNSHIFDFVLESKLIRRIVAEILGCEDFITVHRSAVISMPGCETQSWHSDGPHASATQYLPCHSLNVFVPLVDVNYCNGPTEFRPGSHHYTRDLAKLFLLAKIKKQVRDIEGPSLSVQSALIVSL